MMEKTEKLSQLYSGDQFFFTSNWIGLFIVLRHFKNGRTSVECMYTNKKIRVSSDTKVYYLPF